MVSKELRWEPMGPIQVASADPSDPFESAQTHALPDMHPDVLSIVYTAEELAVAVQSLGSQLASEYADKEPLILGALTGAFTFTADLARAMSPLPHGMNIDFFSASSYGFKGTVSGDVKLTLGGKLPLAGRHVIVVEDIIDTGKTLKCAVEAIILAGAASVKICVLLDKVERRTADIQPDFIAFKCPDEFVIGYGLDFEENYRSLPYIGVLRPEIYANL